VAGETGVDRHLQLQPIGADFVAPDARRVPELVVDLMAYAGRNDIQILAQAAIAHA
jgi:hypothetical protein